MRSSALSMRSYSFIIAGFCLLFLIFGYRSLVRSSSKNKGDAASADYFDEEVRPALSKLVQAKCGGKHVQRIGEHKICGNVNAEKNCLIFSVSSDSDMNFEKAIGERMSKCRVRVYDHKVEKDTGEEGNFKLLEIVRGEHLDEKMFVKILGTEKKGKIHLLRIDAEEETPKLAQLKLLKDRSVCQLLLLAAFTETELGSFVKKMRQSHGYLLYALKESEKATDDDQEEENEEQEEADNGEKEEEKQEEKEQQKGGQKGKEKEGTAGSEKKRQKRLNYALSFVAGHCKKAQGIS